MVDETLKRLLDAESKAELIIARADDERKTIVEKARHDAQAMEQQYTDRLKEIHVSFLDQAEQRALQTIAELKRHHAEHALALRSSAEQRVRQALEDAVTLLTDPSRS